MWPSRLGWFAVISARVRLAVRRDIARRIDNPEESEAISDLTQDALCTAAERIDDFRGSTEQELTAWVCAIGAHKLADYRRSLRRLKRDSWRTCRLDAVIDALADDTVPPDEELVGDEQRRWLFHLLNNLPEPEHSAIRLRYLLGRPVTEVAAHLGRTESAAQGVLKRGLARLRTLARDGEPDAGELAASPRGPAAGA